MSTSDSSQRLPARIARAGGPSWGRNLTRLSAKELGNRVDGVPVYAQVSSGHLDNEAIHAPHTWGWSYDHTPPYDAAG